jgi:hypothetical protein
MSNFWQEMVDEYGDGFPAQKGDRFGLFSAGVAIRREDIAENLVDICLEKGLSLWQSIGLLEGLTVFFDRIEGYLLLGTILFPVSDNSAITRTAHLFFESHAHRGEQGNFFSPLMYSVLSNCQKRTDLFHKSLWEVNPNGKNYKKIARDDKGKEAA